MYLSRIELNTKRRETMQALVVPSIIHSNVEQSFEGSRQRNLWRIDWLDDKCFLLVVSENKPDFKHVSSQFGHNNQDTGWETKSYDSLLHRVAEGDKWQFRLKANPVQNSMANKDKRTGRGKVHAHVTQEQQRIWLMQRAPKCGFMLHEDTFDVVHTQWEKFYKNKNGKTNVTIRTATFEGILTVTVPELFKNTLINGIGKAKAYGCGLLTIMR